MRQGEKSRRVQGWEGRGVTGFECSAGGEGDGRDPPTAPPRTSGGRRGQRKTHRKQQGKETQKKEKKRLKTVGQKTVVQAKGRGKETREREREGLLAHASHKSASARAADRTGEERRLGRERSGGEKEAAGRREGSENRREKKEEGKDEVREKGRKERAKRVRRVLCVTERTAVSIGRI